VSTDPSVLLHGIVAADRSQALIAHVALDESEHNRGVQVRVPGLDPAARYALTWEGPITENAVSMSAPLPRKGPTEGQAMTGTALLHRGFWIPRRPPESATLIRLTRR
jgi:alpha-galactosidase